MEKIESFKASSSPTFHATLQRGNTSTAAPVIPAHSSLEPSFRIFRGIQSSEPAGNALNLTIPGPYAKITILLDLTRILPMDRIPFLNVLVAACDDCALDDAYTAFQAHDFNETAPELSIQLRDTLHLGNEILIQMKQRRTTKSLDRRAMPLTSAQASATSSSPRRVRIC